MGFLKAMLWDCDGVLCYNNEAIAMPVAGHVLNDAIRSLTRDPKILEAALYDIPRFTIEGAGGHFNQFYKTRADILKPFGLELPSLEELDAIKIERTIAEITKDSLPAPGVSEALLFIQSLGVNQAVSTSSELNRVNPGIAKIKGFNFGEHVYSAADTMMDLYGEKRPKPLPDIYIHAGLQFGLDTPELMRDHAGAVEDSKSGIISAVRAGITKYAFGYVGGTHIVNKADHTKMLRDNGATEVFENMLDLRNHIAKLHGIDFTALAKTANAPRPQVF